MRGRAAAELPKMKNLVAEKGLPAWEDAERFVLGSILLDGEKFDRVARVLTADDFSLASNRRIFKRMGELRERGETIDRLTVGHELIRHGELEACGGLTYVNSLDDGVPQITNIDSHIRIVKEYALRRQTIVVSQHTIKRCQIGEEKCRDILADVGVKANNLASQSADHRKGVVLSEVQPQEVGWLWKNRIPAGKVIMLEGDPGEGKSILSLEIAARLTRGEALPGAEGGLEGGVVILTAEDGLADTVRPRLIAAGADLSRIVAVNYGPERAGELRISNIVTGISAIEDAIRQVKARLVIVDVLMAYLPLSTNCDRDQHIRLALAPLAAMADRLGVAVICIRHLRKSAAASPLYRGGGSIGIIGAARAAMLVARDPDDSSYCVLAQTKNNLGPEPPSLRFRIVAADGVPRIQWEGETSHTAKSLLDSSEKDEREARTEAKAFLRQDLSGGPKLRQDVVAAARRLGISERTLLRAKSELGIKSAKEGFRSGWLWYRPQNDCREDGHDNDVATLGGNGRAEAGLPTDNSVTSAKAANDAGREGGQALADFEEARKKQSACRENDQDGGVAASEGDGSNGSLCPDNSMGHPDEAESVKNVRVLAALEEGS